MNHPSQGPALALMVAWALIFIVTARTSRPDLFFAVTVDPAFRRSRPGRLILAAFTRRVVAWTVCGLVLASVGAFAEMPSSFGIALLISGWVVESLGILHAVLLARRQASAHRVTPSLVREASITRRPDRPTGGWIAQAGPFLILLSAALVSIAWRPASALPV